MGEQYWIINFICVFILSVLFAGIIIPQILMVAFKRKLFDDLGERKVHHGKIPRLGGLSFNPCVFLSVVLVFGINIALGYHEISIELMKYLRPLAFGTCAILLIYLVGLLDDLIGVRYRAKFIMQIICATMLVFGNLWLNNLHGLFGIYKLPVVIGCLFTILLTVAIINSVNLIDGIDGLASGLSSIAFLFYGFAFYQQENYFYSMLAFSTLGVLVTFFYYNVFGNPNKHKKIFMGDTGSLTIGMMLCFLSISLADGEFSNKLVKPNVLVLAFAPLCVPCCDLARVYFYRLRHKKNPFLPDKNHIHHKLLALGFSQSKVRNIIVSFSLLLTTCNILLSIYININWLLFGDILLWAIINIWLSRAIKNTKGYKSFYNRA